MLSLCASLILFQVHCLYCSVGFLSFCFFRFYTLSLFPVSFSNSNFNVQLLCIYGLCQNSYSQNSGSAEAKELPVESVARHAARRWPLGADALVVSTSDLHSKFQSF